MTREPDCENASGVAGWGANYCSFVVQMLLDGGGGGGERALRCFCVFLPLCTVALRCQAQMRRDIDGGVVVFCADGDFVRERRERRFKRQIVCLSGRA